MRKRMMIFGSVIDDFSKTIGDFAKNVFADGGERRWEDDWDVDWEDTIGGMVGRMAEWMRR
ncbi:hypothetical protein [Paenibacillus silvestris]|nr:hypothetical protein [Paenibacillus silvestris]